MRRARRAIPDFRAAIAALLLAAAALPAAPVLSWRAEATVPDAARLKVFRGETVEVCADLFDRGSPWIPAAGAVASFLWQTNGMDAAWWTAPASISSNRVSATLTPAMDPCVAEPVEAFFRVEGEGRVLYRARCRLLWQHGPGDPPNALPLPVPVIDFAKIAVTNAPWGASGITTNDVRAIVAEAAAASTNYTDAASERADGRIDTVETDAAMRTAAMGEYAIGVASNYTDAAIAALDIRTNLPPVSASATVGELVDSINAVIRAMRKEDE